jgi:hypothetical protein
MAQTYPTETALATAVAVFEHNGFRIIREQTKDQDGVEWLPNRHHIKQILAKDSAIAVTDEHVKLAEDITQYLQHTITMQTLIKGSTTTGFLADVAELVTTKSVKDRELGILAWAPKLTKDLQAQDEVKQVTASFEHSSMFVGQVGSKITVDFTMIEKRLVRSQQCWIVFGHDQHGNLISYWASKPEKIIEQGTVTAKVKGHIKDLYHNGARVTTINYIKPQ